MSLNNKGELVDVGLIIALITLGLGLTGHIVTTVWWASRITTILEASSRSLMELSIEMKAVSKTYVTKEEFSKDLSHVEKKIDAAWIKIDKLTERN